MGHLDAVQLFKAVAGSLEIFFFAGAVHHQFALSLSGGDQFGVSAHTVFRRGEGHAGKRHYGDQQECQKLFHVKSLLAGKYGI